MSITNVRKPKAIYTTDEEYAAFFIYPYIFNVNSEWIGFLTPNKDVYNIDGGYVGYLTDEPRILRKGSESDKPNFPPPPPPRPVKGRTSMSLSPMMSDLAFGVIDVLQDEPNKLYTQDMAHTR